MTKANRIGELERPFQGQRSSEDRDFGGGDSGTKCRGPEPGGAFFEYLLRFSALGHVAAFAVVIGEAVEEVELDSDDPIVGMKTRPGQGVRLPRRLQGRQLPRRQLTTTRSMVPSTTLQATNVLGISSFC